MGDFIGTVAANTWPMVLGLLTAIIGITLGIRGIKAGFYKVSGMVGGGGKGRKVKSTNWLG